MVYTYDNFHILSIVIKEYRNLYALIYNFMIDD